MAVNIAIPELGEKFKDYRDDIPGDSYSMGPVINAKQVKYFAIHHSVTPKTKEEWGAMVKAGDWKRECNTIANLHIPLYGGVGYRFIIATNGVVAYVGDLSRGGAAVAKHNDEIFSACMIGDFTQWLPTDAQIKSAHILAKHFWEKEPAYPLLDGWSRLIGHKDASQIWNDPSIATACPGISWPNDMKWRIQTGTVYTPGPTPAPPSPPVPPINWEARVKELERAMEALKIEMRTKLAEKDIECQRKLQAYKDQVREIASKLTNL